MKIAILDRDGVINKDSDQYIKSPDEWIAIEGSLKAIARLNHAGYRVYIATNQSGLGRGLFSIETLHDIHQKMMAEIQQEGGHVDAIFFCPHTPEDHCECRKPNAGLLLEIARRANQSLKDVPVFGDSYRDLVAAWAVEASPILVKTGKGEMTMAKHAHELVEIPIYKDLASAVDMLISQEIQKT
jgi:D-glycero-D-manno-heptose 1,7-bisphosphate phosphatase